jgi:arabinose-5-phosphate isomerase
MGFAVKWSESLKKQSNTLERITKNARVNAGISKVEDIFRKTKGFHYFTGVGKNGHVAAHLASTFNSLGIRSMFVDPVNTLHGDMGIFTDNDLVIAISKSGETDELVRFLSALKKMGFDNIICVTSKNNSRIERLSKNSLIIPIEDEGDHIGNMAPIASTLSYLAVLQSIAVQLSSEKGFTKEDFLRSHPGGAIGRSSKE